jgi:DNA-binding MarR family transcriptional regulator
MSDLSRRLTVSNGNMTGLVSRLADEGLIRRGTSPRDRRVQLVFITPKGEAALLSMMPEHRDWVEVLFERMTADERLLMHSLLERLEKSVRSADAAGALA